MTAQYETATARSGWWKLLIALAIGYKVGQLAQAVKLMRMPIDDYHEHRMNIEEQWDRIDMLFNEMEEFDE